jgi:hypothetical protein
MIGIYNSPILKWERFKAHLKRRRSTATLITAVMDNVERAIYAAVESGAKVNILSELEKALEDYRGRLIRKSVD